jgi:general secretion pathway protein G
MVTMNRRTSCRRGQRGFTLIELIVVVTIIGILAGIAVVQVRTAQHKAIDTAVRADLHEMRKAIDDFYADKQRYPTDLNELAPHYLRVIPKDPVTKQPDWQQISDTPEPDQQADPAATTTSGPGIIDVKSKAPGKTVDGTPYSDL